MTHNVPTDGVIAPRHTRGISSALILLVMMTVALVLSGARPVMIDDTFITLQYARSLAETGFPYWHLELPRVDGFTSTGHMLLLAFGLKLGVDPILWNSFLQFSSVGVILFIFLAYAQSLPFLAGAAGLFVISVNVSLLFWVGGGLDAVPYAAAFFATYTAMERCHGKRYFGPLAALALIVLSLMRPEGLIIAAGLVFYWIGYLLWHRRSLAGIALLWVGFVATALFAQIMLRMALFGHALPNAVYAKRSSSFLLEVEAGLDYLFRWFDVGGSFLLAALVMCAILRRSSLFRLTFVLGQIALVVMAGGDPHPAFRFLLPLVPVLAIDMAVLMAARRAPAVLATCLILGYTYIQVLTLPAPGTPTAKVQAGVERILAGRWPLGTAADSEQGTTWQRIAERYGVILREVGPVAATDVGALTYFSRLPIRDAAGLNDPAIATLDKPEGMLNKWGIRRLDVLMAEEISAVIIGFPKPADFSWQEVNSGVAVCSIEMRNQLSFLMPVPEEVHGPYLCASVGEGKDWLNFFVHSQTVLPEGVEASKCIKNLQAMCGARFLNQ